VTLMARGQVAHGRDAGGNTPPRRIGSSASPLMTKVLEGHNKVSLDERQRRMIRLWIESGAPYPGTYAALGTGMVDVGLDDEVLGRRCASCHGSKDPKRRVEFRTHRELLVNLTRPEKSLLVLAPLAKEAGGLDLCRRPPAKGRPARPVAETPVFAARDDADCRKLVAGIAKAKARLDGVKRFDMAGFRPNEHYLREMKRYGVLPADLAGDAAVDPYATDERYWRSFWYVPEAR